MARTKYYSDSSVSRSLDTSDYNWAGVIFQSGKPVLDAEVNLQQDIQQVIASKRAGIPSGFKLKSPFADTFSDYNFSTVDPNTFFLSKQTAYVAGYPITVEFTNTSSSGTNLIQLDTPPTHSSPPLDTKRTDFVFLEAWFVQVIPSTKASATVTLASLPSAGDQLVLNGIPLTAVAGAPAADEFQIGANTAATVSNMINAINNPANSFSATFSAALLSSGGDVFVVKAVAAGAAGNALTISSSVPAVIDLGGATNLSGGADKPNKPSQDTVYRHGNVTSPLGVALADDLTDPVIKSQTSQRVQLQYRIRVTSNTEAVNYKTSPDGFSAAALEAQGAQGAPVSGYTFVPADGSTVSTSTLSSAAAFGDIDNGLWIAGDGSSSAASDLGTLDGYVYAIPIAFVFRRNSGGFDAASNANGAVLAASGTTDRPDNYFADVIYNTDVLDLRRHILVNSSDYGSILKSQVQSLLDGSLKTWAIDTSDKQLMGNGSGDISTRNMVCNEIGRTAAHGGTPSDRGVLVREFDHVARRFGSQPVVERAVFALLPSDTTIATGAFVTKIPATTGWCEGDTITLDLATINPSTGALFTGVPSLGGVAITDFMPPNTVISNILRIEHDDGNFNASILRDVQMSSIVGLGTPKVEITLDRNDSEATGGLNVPTYPLVGSTATTNPNSIRRIFIELEITYPSGTGLTDTPDEILIPDPAVFPSGPIIENDVAQRPTDFQELLSPDFRAGFREVAVEYVANNGTAATPITDSFVSIDPTSIRFLGRVYEDLAVTVEDASTSTLCTVDNAASKFGDSERLIVLDGGTPLAGAGQTLVNATYFPQEPLSNFGASGYQVSIYYRTQAPQTAGVKNGVFTDILPVELSVEPLAIGDRVWTLTSSVGFTDLPYPYLNPSDKVACKPPTIPATEPEEWFFCGSSEVALDNFDASTGLLTLPQYIPIDVSNPLSLGGLSNAPDADAEFRAFYPTVNEDGYKPMTAAQPFIGASRHKTFVPLLARSLQDTLLFRKDEIVLVLFSHWTELSADNVVSFGSTGNAVASVYRTKNLLLMVG